MPFYWPSPVLQFLLPNKNTILFGGSTLHPRNWSTPEKNMDVIHYYCRPRVEIYLDPIWKKNYTKVSEWSQNSHWYWLHIAPYLGIYWFNVRKFKFRTKICWCEVWYPMIPHDVICLLWSDRNENCSEVGTRVLKIKPGVSTVMLWSDPEFASFIEWQ